MTLINFIYPFLHNCVKRGSTTQYGGDVYDGSLDLK